MAVLQTSTFLLQGPSVDQSCNPGNPPRVGCDQTDPRKCFRNSLVSISRNQLT